MPEYSIPLWHPLVVHFPVALLPVAALAAVLWAWRGTDAWRNATALLLALGALGAFVARLTGEAAAEQSEGVPIVEALVADHATGALWTVVMAALALVALGGTWWYEARYGQKAKLARALVVLLALGAAATVAWTGHLGGLMVWGVPN